MKQSHKFKGRAIAVKYTDEALSFLPSDRANYLKNKAFLAIPYKGKYFYLSELNRATFKSNVEPINPLHKANPLIF